MYENVYITYNKMSNDNERPVYVRYFPGQSCSVCGWYETGQRVMGLCAISNVCQILGVLSMSAFLDGTDDDSRGRVFYVIVSCLSAFSH